EQQRPAVGEGRKRRRVAFEHLKAVAGQAQVADDLFTKEAVNVGGRGHLEAGKDFFGDAGPADDRAALQDEYLLARPRQVARRHQTVVAGADNDRVEMRCHDSCPPRLGPSGSLVIVGPIRLRAYTDAMTNPDAELAGQLHVYVAFDWGEEVNLE